MPQIIDADFFHQSFGKSLGSLFQDFYAPQEIECLESEIRERYLALDGGEIETVLYVPGSGDPLLRLQHTVVLIACDSLPFFASRIRKVFQILNLEVSRSLHFHPQEGRELYYIEILGTHTEYLKKLIDGICTAYKKIQKLIASYREFVSEEGPRLELWSEEIRELLEWLLQKSYVWEGARLALADGRIRDYGEFELPQAVGDWFLGLPFTEAERVEARESSLRSFLGDDKVFYIVFVKADRKLLMIGCLNQFAKASALVDIPYFNERFRRFLSREKIEVFSGLGRTTRMLFNYIPTEIIFLLPESYYIKLHSAMIEHSLRTALRSVGVQLSTDLGLVVSFVPEKNWSDVTWESSDRIIQDIFPDSQVRRYFVVRGNVVEAFHLIRSREMDSHKLFEASSRIEFSFRSWMEELENRWTGHFSIPFAEADLDFHEDYKATHTPEQCILDLKMVGNMGDLPLQVEITQRPDTTILHAVTPRLKFFLSQWVDVLNGMGFTPISQRVYHFQFQGKTFAKSEFFFHFVENRKNLYNRWKQVFTRTMLGQIRSDSLSSAILWTGLDADGLVFAKAIRDYCLQANVAFNPEELNRYLVAHPGLLDSAWSYFRSTFQDGNSIERDRLIEESDQGKTIREDEALHAFASTVLAILRTDFFGIPSSPQVGVARDYISFKLDSSIPTALPDPRPYRETFIYSSYFQGIHLRGGAVARGGIRFSDRVTDYRTELLSLLKTQMVKNSIIVPVGSKGCFVLTPNPLLDREIQMVTAYKGYISGLLGLSDNRKKGEILPFDSKNGSLPYALDGTDPYLVVAADKGTAQLSDTANFLSEKAEFWLGDAFASGGSRGYSHKEYGITAKGALVTADRNLRILGVDFRTEPITVAGIGDMGGDVFGNGLLESEYFCLVASFNHKHIFIDPNPDPKISFEERKRLFHSSSSGWDSYDPKRISPGGGIWNRTEKSIPLSEEARKVLGVTQTHLSGNQIIQAILKAPVDLLYNGGIGTYVKASDEDHSKVGDPTNNEVRVDARSLRCKVVSEGGNLGFTQRARIEFDRSGGYIFTDAVDNSAGVDLSDHEVNLKIILNDLLEMGVLADSSARNALLKKIDHEVVESVLCDNYLQSLCVNVDHWESRLEGWKEFQDATGILIQKGVLEPQLSQIPRTPEEWQAWKVADPSLPRPALATLMGHAKMDLYKTVLAAQVFTPMAFPELYLGYYPKTLVDAYREELFLHPLGLEICTTRSVNFLVNLLGVRIYSLMPQAEPSAVLFLKKLMGDLEELGLPRILDRLATIRNKHREVEVLETVHKLRVAIRKKWGETRDGDTSWVDSWTSELAEQDLTAIKKLIV